MDIRSRCSAPSSLSRGRVRVLAGIDFSNVGPGWAQRAVAQLEADVAARAVGIGEIPKNLGQTISAALASVF